MQNGFTPTQRAILAMLSDGMAHSKDELMACLNGEQISHGALHWHVCMINRKLRPKGEEVVCQYVNRTGKYRHIRHLARD